MAKNKTPRVTLYSTRNCAYCKQAKTALKGWHIPFREMDIENNHLAHAEFLRLKARGVPVISVGNKHLFGFDTKRLQDLLSKSGFQLKS